MSKNCLILEPRAVAVWMSWSWEHPRYYTQAQAYKLEHFFKKIALVRKQAFALYCDIKI